LDSGKICGVSQHPIGKDEEDEKDGGPDNCWSLPPDGKPETGRQVDNVRKQDQEIDQEHSRRKKIKLNCLIEMPVG
jgi:hypothetical protein